MLDGFGAELGGHGNPLSVSQWMLVGGSLLNVWGSEEEEHQPTDRGEKGTGEEPQSSVDDNTGDKVRNEPKHDLQREADDGIRQDHAALAEAMRRLREQQPAQETAAAERSGDVTYGRERSRALLHQIFDDPARDGDDGAQVEEIEQAQ